MARIILVEENEMHDMEKFGEFVLKWVKKGEIEVGNGCRTKQGRGPPVGQR